MVTNVANTKADLNRGRARFPWLEVLLALAMASLLVQLLPNVFTTITAATDVTRWPRSVWFLVNVVTLGLLFGVRSQRHPMSGIARRLLYGMVGLTIAGAAWQAGLCLDWAYVRNLLKRLLDFTEWSRVGWFRFTVVIFAILCGIRFVPDAITTAKNFASSKWDAHISAREAVREKAREKAQQERTIAGKVMTSSEERALYERLKDARKRQIY